MKVKMIKTKLNELVENLVFAMGMDDVVPERILEDIFRHNKNKDPHVANELESLSAVEDFNSEVDAKLGTVTVAPTQEQFFSDIVGYGDIKKLLVKCIQSNSMHVILDGPPASAKSMFLLAMEAKLPNAYYVDGTNATGPGMVKYLFENDVQFLLLDEVEKMSISNQNVLLNVMETGILTSTKVKQTRTKAMNISIYATTNDVDAISKPFRSRFMEFSLPEYTYEDFCEIAVQLLNTRYEHSEELALKIADTVWNKMQTKDVRDMIQIGKLSKTVEDVDFVAEMLQKYKRKSEE